jgi:hypothetical protein
MTTELELDKTYGVWYIASRTNRLITTTTWYPPLATDYEQMEKAGWTIYASPAQAIDGHGKLKWFTTFQRIPMDPPHAS